MKTVLVDMMNIIFIEYHITCRKLHEEGKEFDEENKSLFFHMFLTKINYMFTTYGKMIFCWEGKGSTAWRKSIYPGYKENRKASREEDGTKLLISMIPEIEEVLNYYPCKQIRIENAEGDDCIFKLAEKYSKENEEGVLILSTDKDLIQIKNFFNNVEIFNPIRREYVKENELILEEKAICGDPSDGIPGLNRIGPKTFAKMIDNKEEWVKVMSKGNNREVYSCFRKIVDLRQVPEKIQKNILDKEEKIEYNKFEPDLIELFFINNELNSLRDKWMWFKEDIAKVSGCTINNNFVSEEKAREINKDLFISDASEEGTEIDDILKEFL